MARRDGESVGINFGSSGFYRTEPEFPLDTKAWLSQIENSAGKEFRT